MNYSPIGWSIWASILLHWKEVPYENEVIEYWDSRYHPIEDEQ